MNSNVDVFASPIVYDFLNNSPSKSISFLRLDFECVPGLFQFFNSTQSFVIGDAVVAADTDA